MMIGVIKNAGALSVLESLGAVIDPCGETWSMPTHIADHSLKMFIPIQKVSKTGQRNDKRMSMRYAKRGR